MNGWFAQLKLKLVRSGSSGADSSRSPRDTDDDWRIIGEEDPFFGVLTHSRFHRENLTDDALTDFYSSGESDLGGLLARSREIFGPFNPRSALDFGCGVGRLTRPLAQLTGDVVGVDVSRGMLREARQRVPDAVFVERIPDRTFDWVVSFIVLQHITPAAGYPLICELLKAVAPGGRISLHITFARAEAYATDAGAMLVIGETHVWPVEEAWDTSLLPQGVMIMHDYDLSRVLALFYQQGFRSLHLDSTDHGGVVGAVIHAERQHD